MGQDLGPVVTDESSRRAALDAVFSGMSIVLEPGKKIDEDFPKTPGESLIDFPDALKDEPVYRVTGPAMNDAERCASEDLVTGKLSSVRELRFRVFQWPNELNTGLLAVLQYDFPDASPAMACPSIGLLVHLKKTEHWTIEQQYLLETAHHGSLNGIRLLDLDGKGLNRLFVESDSGGAGTVLSNLQLFDLRNGRLDEVLNTPSRMMHEVDDL